MSYNPLSSQDRQVLASELTQMLTAAKFVKIEGDNHFEDLYQLNIPQLPGVTINVYTTIVNGEVREKGSDAIRVSVVYKRKDGGYRQLFSETRINRTGEISKIVERTLERMRSVYATLRDQHKPDQRPKYQCYCGAPKFTAKSGKLVCSDTCWDKKNK